MDKEPSRLDKIKARLAALYLELGQATARSDVRLMAVLQAEIKVLLRARAVS